MDEIHLNHIDAAPPHFNSSIPCFFLCVILFLILGILPIVPDAIIKLVKPVFIVLCILFPGRGNYRLGYERWLVILMLYMMMICVLSQNLIQSIKGYLSMLLFALFLFFAGLHRWNSREIRAILKSTILAGFVCSVIVIYSSRGMLSQIGSQHLNFLFTTTNRNALAFSIAPGAVASALAFFCARRGIGERVKYAACFVLCYTTVVLLSCRSAFLSATTGVFLLVWQRLSRRETAKRIFQRSLFLVFLYVVIIISTSLLQGTMSARLFDYSESGREGLWDSAMELIWAKPVFGGGFGYWERSGQSMGTHNTFLTVALISGFVGAAVLGIMIFSMVKECLLIHSVIALAFAMEMFFHSISESGLDYYAYIPLILTSVILHYMEYQRKDISTVFNL